MPNTMPPSPSAPLLSKARIVAKPGFNRWLVAPAALAVHLCIGQVYAFSVFNLPLTKTLGITESLPEDWRLTELGWIFSLAIVFLGLSAAFAGKWLETVGPRVTMFCAALCFSGGFFIAAAGVWTHTIALLYLGYGVLGGIGLGLGYVSPVSTLIKWFPDHRGMATGLAIMGFGGGAMLGAPLSVMLMKHFSNPSSNGVAATFITLGCIYLAFMLIGAFSIRIPAEDWLPADYTPSTKPQKLVTQNSVHVDQVLKTPQFYLLWLVLCLNVTAGIGVLGQASAMSQEMFKDVFTPEKAAAFVSLLSFFNMGGRFVWSTLSDYFGRKNTYFTFFLLGCLLYNTVPFTGQLHNVPLFIACYAVIMSMYGGGFATIPAYLADIFGTDFVGAIHGRLLTAWAVAGVAGPVLVNYLRESQIASGVAKADAYNITMHIMAGLLALGFLSNWAISAVDPKHHLPKKP